jgi:hypothetical protein
MDAALDDSPERIGWCLRERGKQPTQGGDGRRRPCPAVLSDPAGAPED